MEPQRHTSPSQACSKHLLTHLTLKMSGEPLTKPLPTPTTSWPGTIVIPLLLLTTVVTMSYHTTGGPGKEYGMNNYQPEEFGKCQKEKGDASPYVLPSFQHPSHWNPSQLNDAHGQERPCIRMTGQRQGVNCLITIKPETVSHVVEQLSLVPLPTCPLLRCPFPIKSHALSTGASPWTIHCSV